MRLSPLFDQQLEAAQLSGLQQGLQQGKQEGRQEGRQEGERLVVENLLRFRFGTVDEELMKIIDVVLNLPPSEFTPLLVELSREELLSRFRGEF